MKCYFACNDRSHAYDPLIKALVTSAIKNTTLDMYCIYDGKPNDLTEWLEERNVHIIYHRSNFYDAMENHYASNLKGLITASGTFLRCDIPMLETQDDYILYVDCDVIFIKDIDFSKIEKPEYFACAQEFDKNDYTNFNAGIMYMNIKNLRATYEEFKNYITNNLDKLYTFDQTAYQFFYGREKLTILPEIYNHKPYWGVDENAVIIHYHGPKPYDFESLFKLAQNPARILVDKSPEGYIYYLKLFKEYLPEIKYMPFVDFKIKHFEKYTILRRKIKNFLRKKLYVPIK